MNILNKLIVGKSLFINDKEFIFVKFLDRWSKFKSNNAATNSKSMSADIIEKNSNKKYKLIYQKDDDLTTIDYSLFLIEYNDNNKIVSMKNITKNSIL